VNSPFRYPSTKGIHSHIHDNKEFFHNHEYVDSRTLQAHITMFHSTETNLPKLSDVPEPVIVSPGIKFTDTSKQRTLEELLADTNSVADPREEYDKLSSNIWNLIHEADGLQKMQNVPWYTSAAFTQRVGSLIRKANVLLAADINALNERFHDIVEEADPSER
jgi:hypothetical protein